MLLKSLKHLRLQYLVGSTGRMSSFTNYESKAATDYDVTRIPVGIEIYEGAIRKYAPERDFTKVKVLDLGAGTGSYDKLLLDNGIGHITCADVSQISRIS